MKNFNAPQYDPRTLHYIFLFLLIGQIALVFVVLYIINRNGATFNIDLKDIPTFSLPIMVISTNFIAQKIFQQQWNKMAHIEDLEKKMQTMQLAHIVEWIMVEGGTLILLVFSQLENNQYFIILAILNIIYFYTLRPKILMLNEDF